MAELTEKAEKSRQNQLPLLRLDTLLGLIFHGIPRKAAQIIENKANLLRSTLAWVHSSQTTLECCYHKTTA